MPASIESNQRVALFTAVYPGVEAYIPDWYQSVRAQTFQDFDLWVAADGVETSEVNVFNDIRRRAVWRESLSGQTPATIRQEALSEIVELYDVVVLVDSDDVMAPSRVEKAIARLKSFDVVGCAMTVIDESGADTGVTMCAPSDIVEEWLPIWNVFGGTNSAYRCDALKACLPIPKDCALVDWFLATRAWAGGWRLGFDHVERMSYRQYDANTAQILPPFHAEVIVQSAALVLLHYAQVLNACVDDMPEAVRTKLDTAHLRVQAFQEAMVSSSSLLDAYVEALNRLLPEPMWWACVAHPKLEEIWKS